MPTLDQTVEDIKESQSEVQSVAFINNDQNEDLLSNHFIAMPKLDETLEDLKKKQTEVQRALLDAVFQRFHTAGE